MSEGAHGTRKTPANQNARAAPGIAEARLLQRRPGAPPDPGPATPAAAQTSGAAGPSPGVEDERISMKPLVDVATIRMWLAAKASQAGLA